ncbi:hypothetical protein NL676_033300 [Syzygium grande]|nr:hypothetical protein NL676_033300 [Syzygium grande]
MSSENPSKHQLPKIDFSISDLNPGSTSWDLVRGDVMTALEEYGCFEAAMGINGVLDSPATQNFTKLMWPIGNARFCEIVQSYSSNASELEKMVKRMILEGLQLPVEKYHNDLIERSTNFLRMTKYEAPKKGGTQEVGGISHNDRNFVTVLRQDGSAWSNGRLYSPLHRVVMSGTRARHSIGLFLTMKGEIRCPGELVDEQQPLLFKPF